MTEQKEIQTEVYAQRKLTPAQHVLFWFGLLSVIVGVSILAFFGVRKLYREYRKQQLMKENCVIEITALHIKAPVLEGTEQEVLSRAVGHFPETGQPGRGNYCLAGHSSVLYKEYFNHLKYIEKGMEITIYDKQKNSYVYIVSESFIVEPNETWVLNDFQDDRITLITCTDDGTQRQVVVGILR